jgi:hypothetical protein
MLYETLHRKLKIEKHETYKKQKDKWLLLQ